MSEPKSVIGATRSELHTMDPATIAPALRLAIADRCMHAGRSLFARAVRDPGTASSEQMTTEARAWMRERKRWASHPNSQTTTTKKKEATK